MSDRDREHWEELALMRWRAEDAEAERDQLKQEFAEQVAHGLRLAEENDRLRMKLVDTRQEVEYQKEHIDHLKDQLERKEAIGNALKREMERSDRLRKQLTLQDYRLGQETRGAARLRGALGYIRLAGGVCPCGAWLMQENERPHVIGCPVGRALEGREQ